MKISKENWIWMPHPAHLIVARDCKFFLATKIGDYIVSTVGEYWPDRVVREIHASIHDPEWHEKNNHLKGDAYDYAYSQKFGFEDIAYDTKYETMVFRAIPNPKDDERFCPACPFRLESGDNVDCERYKKAKDAYEGHLKMCDKFANE